jgi:hypothetical protein
MFELFGTQHLWKTPREGKQTSAVIVLIYILRDLEIKKEGLNIKSFKFQEMADYLDELVPFQVFSIKKKHFNQIFWPQGSSRGK